MNLQKKAASDLEAKEVLKGFTALSADGKGKFLKSLRVRGDPA
ncbi:hypothetical protein [Streptomyces sp. NBC_00648]